MSLQLYQAISRKVESVGISLFGGVDLDLVPEELSAYSFQNYSSWLDRGYAGEMHYLLRGKDRREDVRRVFPSTKSVLTFGFPYQKTLTGNETTVSGAKYARYLYGEDYHRRIPIQLEQILSEVKAENSAQEMSWKICVDTSAVLERSWGVLTGLGWIGKNGMLINPKEGSYFFLAVVLVNFSIGVAPSLQHELCGNCNRCRVACPTQAIFQDKKVDSRKCVSYLTLEYRGDFSDSVGVREKIGSWIAGCDVCQEVCPFNFKPVKAEARITVRESQDAVYFDQWTELLKETEEEYSLRIRTSALRRVKWRQFQRNLAIALSNTIEIRDPQWIEIIENKIKETGDPALRAEWERCLSKAQSVAKANAVESNRNLFSSSES